MQNQRSAAQSRPPDTNTEMFDVAVLGSGLTGSLVALLLAHRGYRVAIIDGKGHPRFAIGESTVGHTSEVMAILADRYDLPELKHLATFDGIRNHVSNNCGVKRGFGFVYFAKDGSQAADEANQFVIPPFLHGPENHLFRQDVDAYLYHCAVRRGATGYMGESVEDFTFHEDEVVLDTSRRTIRCRFLVDGSGFNSPLTRKLGLRESPPRTQHHARSLFTHMVNVRPYDEGIEPGVHGMPLPWYQTTLHHLFEGGWIWVIPFDNHRHANNPLCSVGLTVDPRVHPQPEGMSPEQEFRAFIARYPTIAKQFEDATAVRPWVSAPRIQHSTTAATGARFCLMSHACGFIDPLFSRGLANSLDVILALMPRLMSALNEDDFSEERFDYVNKLSQGLVDFNDQLVSTAYASFSHYALWNAWVRVWAIGEAGLDQLRLLSAHLNFLEDGNEEHFARLDQVLYPGLVCPDNESFKQLWDYSMDQVWQSHRGEIDPATAAANIFGKIEEVEIISPSFRLHDPKVRCVGGDMISGISAMRWGKRKSRPEIRDNYYSFKMRSLLGICMKNAGELVRKY